jgi:hypothetical protein
MLERRRVFHVDARRRCLVARDLPARHDIRIGVPTGVKVGPPALRLLQPQSRALPSRSHQRPEAFGNPLFDPPKRMDPGRKSWLGLCGRSYQRISPLKYGTRMRTWAAAVSTITVL